MSGSNGDIGGAADPILRCESISFNTDVNSPQAEALAGLEVKDKLDVVLDNYIVVVRRQDTGDLVGTINWSSIARLIECLEEGHAYVALIRDIEDGLVKVHVSRK